MESGRRRLFWYLRRAPRTIREDVDEEIRLHLEMRVEELMAQGVPPEKARREALRRFGDVEGTRDARTQHVGSGRRCEGSSTRTTVIPLCRS